MDQPTDTPEPAPEPATEPTIPGPNSLGFDQAFQRWQTTKLEELAAEGDGCVTPALWIACSKSVLLAEPRDAGIEDLASKVDDELARRLNRCRMLAFHMHQPPVELAPGAIRNPMLVFDLRRGVVRNRTQAASPQYEMVLLVNADDYENALGPRDPLPSLPPATHGRDDDELRDRGHLFGRASDFLARSAAPVARSCRVCQRDPPRVTGIDRKPSGWLVGVCDATAEKPEQEIYICPDCVLFVRSSTGG